MKTVIISESASFPWGMASSSRVKLIAKGLKYIGHSALYIGLRGAHAEYSKNKRRSGVYEGIPYKYPGPFAVRPSNWLLRRVDDFIGTIKSILSIIYLKRRNDIELLVIYTNNYNTVKRWTRVAKMLKVKTALDVCEWPVYIKNSKNANNYCYKSMLYVDSLFVISKYIDNEIKKIYGIDNIIRIPILIDIDQYNSNGSKNKQRKKYFVYSGSSSYPNIAINVLETTKKLKSEGINYKVIFTGMMTKEYKKQIDAYINDNSLSDLVEYTGYLEEDKMVELMEKAMLLLAPVPSDKQTMARFPTKLGYYLASGTPVLTCPVGDIGTYLTDEYNAYLVDQFDSSVIKEKIKKILTKNLTDHNKIGMNGRDTSFKNFDYKKVFNDINSKLNNI